MSGPHDCLFNLYSCKCPEVVWCMMGSVIVKRLGNVVFHDELVLSAATASCPFTNRLEPVLSLNKTFYIFTACWLLLCCAKAAVCSQLQASHWGSRFISDLELHRTVRDLVCSFWEAISKAAQLSLERFIFPASITIPPRVQVRGTQGPIRFDGFPQGPSSAFFKDSLQSPPESTSSAAFMCGNVTSSRVGVKQPRCAGDPVRKPAH